ncbi:MAG: hypothetical protein AAF599_11590, partial [Bacteroidota bacterium]
VLTPDGVSEMVLIAAIPRPLHNERENLAPARLNHGTYTAPSKDGDTSPLVITGDKDEFTYHQFEMIAFLNDLNQQPFAKAVHDKLARHERNLKYRRR